jgi:hypothetical protein
MSDTPVAEQVAERESLKTRNWVLGSALAILFLVVQSLLTYNITSAMSKVDQTNLTLAKVLTAQEVQQVENKMTNSRLELLEKRADSHEQRLNTSEQRQAITDAYMSTHK